MTLNRSTLWRCLTLQLPLLLALLLPWLNPFAPGPSPEVVPYLVTLAGVALLLWRLPLDGSGQRLVAAALLLAGLSSSAIGLIQYFGHSAAWFPWISTTAAGEAFANLRQRNQYATLTSMALATLLWWLTQLRLPLDLKRGHAAISDPLTAAPAGADAHGSDSGHDVAAVASASASASSASGGSTSGGSTSGGSTSGGSTSGGSTSSASDARRQRRWLVGGLLAAVLLGLGNAASASRTGALQWLVLAVLLLLWRRSVRQRALWLALGLAWLSFGLGLLLLPRAAGLDPDSIGLLSRIAQGDAACASRITLWRNVWHLITLRPWLGWGWGELDYAHFITPYTELRFCDILDNAHNLPLHLALVWGLPAALLLCGLALWALWRAQPWHEAAPARQLGWQLLTLLGLHSLLEYPLWYGPFQVAALWGLGLLLPKTFADTVIFLEKTPLALVGRALVATILIACVGYAGHDYWRISQVYLPPEQRAPAYASDPIEKTRDSWLYAAQVNYAWLTTTPLTRANAQQMLAQAQALLHFSPEPRVVEKLIESAVMLGHDALALQVLDRYRAAFPLEYGRWAQRQTGVAPADD